MALSNLEKALIERLHSGEHTGIDLNAAAASIHEITRIQAPDDETPANYIRRAVQEYGENQYQAGITYAANIVYGASFVNFSSDSENPAAYIQRVVMELRNFTKDPIIGLDLAAEAYKQFSGFHFNTQSGKPIDYLIEMAKRHKQLFELDRAVEIEPGLQVAAEILTKDTKTWMPGEPAQDYIKRVAGWYQQPLNSISMVSLVATISGIPVNNGESNHGYITRIAEIAKRVHEPKQSPVDTQAGIQEAAILISSRAGMPFLPGESYGDYLARVADKLHGNYAQGAADVVIKLREAANIRFKDNESNDDYVCRIGEIAKRAPKPNSKFSELLDTIANRACVDAMREDESDIDFVKRCLDEIENHGYAAAASARSD